MLRLVSCNMACSQVRGNHEQKILDLALCDFSVDAATFQLRIKVTQLKDAQMNMQLIRIIRAVDSS